MNDQMLNVKSYTLGALEHYIIQKMVTSHIVGNLILSCFKQDFNQVSNSIRSGAVLLGRFTCVLNLTHLSHFLTLLPLFGNLIIWKATTWNNFVSLLRIPHTDVSLKSEMVELEITILCWFHMKWPYSITIQIQLQSHTSIMFYLKLKPFRWRFMYLTKETIMCFGLLYFLQGEILNGK